MRTFLIAGNWKMNAEPSHAAKLASEMANNWSGKSFTSEALICPPSISIPGVINAFEGSDFKTGAQNVHTEDNGAYTGEISTSMLKDAGCEYVIVGHSERREYNGEDNNVVAAKAKKAVDDGLKAIVCVGEVLEERKENRHKAVVKGQVETAIKALDKANADSLVIAYEPVWAIGTGETATPEQAQEMHEYIRGLIAAEWDNETADSIRILYGGSMKPANAEELLSQPDVDGGLIGGASLKADSFSEIISISESIKS